MGFAERYGFVKEKTVQVDEIDRSLRNRLYNMVHRFSESSPMIHEELEYVVDRLGYQVESTTNRINVQHPANQRPGLIHIRHALQLYKSHALMGPHHQQPMGLTALGRKIHPLASG